MVTGYDYTVRGEAIEGGLLDKRPYAERMAHDQKVPLIRLVEGVGASVRGVKSMGATDAAPPFPAGKDPGGQPVTGARRFGCSVLSNTTNEAASAPSARHANGRAPR